ncbi:extracellular matrix/biofilm biosynthesis regulator RemA family protein [Ilyobacter polytropus]|uniref:Putative regulatory protein Ilyop_0182 n=1 Tax=Ilyobacter polytropus (strain ATCC 51220 / DSM 2926 / LMG 16218 / CuHBu1) TaxID=572544 RepID=E3H7L7_ILYPC|nr:extracellular matrix/biofilm biosynthesis regulator RemA family protein [Ilyobacter polytropus]ADO81971.1 protein of unknown function DUF370 [Ilyobacter polytropus DSM 2926]
MRPINIGFGNMVIDERIIGIIAPDSAPSKRLKEEAKTQNKLIDATFGRKTRALIITDSDHVIMSAINPETIAVRIEKGE